MRRFHERPCSSSRAPLDRKGEKMKLGKLYFYVRSWKFSFKRIDRDMWQLRFGWLMISRMPHGNHAV